MKKDDEFLSFFLDPKPHSEYVIWTKKAAEYGSN